MPKLTPLEQAIALKTDRRLRYVERMRSGGNHKLTMWVPSGSATDFTTLAGAMVALGADAAPFAAELSKLAARAVEQRSAAVAKAGATDDGPRS